ncbi:hypothetical protein BACINT_01718 [Bacteroides intestinalis DSM 17393]|uniref:Uncharacterized protein n=1 Tax=Bacteroides intestinalis DSM 17393 TaxID=471870 RepID=B3C823_9BACE|nr:hypothetical protein BACINT_01718 [Bacteroides intestinalis DSM 17393]
MGRDSISFSTSLPHLFGKRLIVEETGKKVWGWLFIRLFRGMGFVFGMTE